jgi:16S rRNA (guanine966-N2)-methyltransferase
MSRIISGSAGGRRISMPPGSGTRPTTDRVREAIFSAIAAWAGTSAAAPDQALAGLGFCDLYAGSGSVGLEAASRGAGPVLLVKHDRHAVQHIRRNAAELGLSVTVKVADVPSLLHRSAPAGFDVVFADPPYDYASEVVDAQLVRLIDHGWVSRQGLIILERSGRSAPPNWPGVVPKSWARPYGETTVYFGSLEGKESV